MRFRVGCGKGDGERLLKVVDVELAPNSIGCSMVDSPELSGSHLAEVVHQMTQHQVNVIGVYFTKGDHDGTSVLIDMKTSYRMCTHMAYYCGENALNLLDPEVGFVFQLCSLGGPTSVKEDVEEMADCVLSAVEALGSTRVIIGSTYADLVDDDNISTQGVAARWRQTYEPRGFTGLLVVGAVTDDQVVGCLAEYEMMPLELARLYERLLDEAIPEPLDHSREIAGGGRLGTTKRKVGLVYAALGP